MLGSPLGVLSFVSETRNFLHAVKRYSTRYPEQVTDSIQREWDR